MKFDMSVKENLLQIKSEIPPHVTLVAVSKTWPVDKLMEAYDAGQRIFGENKVQEMCDKQPMMPADTEWHMIGHLQSNKVKYMASFVKMIHGIDSLKLLIEVDKQAKKHSRAIDCLLQVHIAQEESKFGMNEEELDALLHSTEFAELKNVKIKGLMGMATFTDDQEQIKKEFTYLKTLFDKHRNTNPDFAFLSMGMSGDYQLAIACGSNMVRIGSSIFGSR